ncbi:MAG: phosphonate metabolism transcriptional regulator PhnF [Pseudomonadota bacterium]
MLERQTGSAIWGQIARSLETEIQSGKLKPGDRLASENALAQRFGVNRHTVRRAVGELAHRGLLRVEHGRGTFVREAPIEYPINDSTKFTEVMLSMGVSSDRKLISSDVQRATDQIAQLLKIAPNAPVVAAEYLSLVDNRPFGFSVHTFPEQRMPGILSALRKSPGVTAALREAGVASYRRIWTQVTAELATDTIADVLDVPASRPMLKTTVLEVATDTGEPVQYGITYWSGDRCRLTVSGQHT